MQYEEKKQELQSRPARALWIEIEGKDSRVLGPLVEAREGRVD